MKSKVLSTIIVCLIIVSLSISVFSAEENTIGQNQEVNTVEENKTLQQQQEDVKEKLEQSNSKLEYVQSELTTSLQKVEELEDSISSYQSQYDDLSNQVATLESKIRETSAFLEETQAQYNRKETLLKKRVVALYEAGDTSYLDLLLSSKNIVEFLSNYFMIGEIAEYDNEILDELNAKKKEIELEKIKQEKQESELRVARTQSNQTRIVLENTKIIQEDYMNQLTNEEMSLQQQIAQYKKEQQEIENQIASAIGWSGTLSIQFTGGPMIWPVGMDGTYITSGFGNRLHPIQGVYKNHDGIDISGPGINGAPVVVAADGVVVYAGWMGGYGNCVMVAHGDEIVSLYGHGLEILAQVGQTVKQGDIIMKVGSTGNSTGPHLHFEIRKNGVATSPIPYLNGESTQSEETENTQTNTQTSNEIT